MVHCVDTAPISCYVDHI